MVSCRRRRNRSRLPGHGMEEGKESNGGTRLVFPCSVFQFLKDWIMDGTHKKIIALMLSFFVVPFFPYFFFFLFLPRLLIYNLPFNNPQNKGGGDIWGGEGSKCDNGKTRDNSWNSGMMNGNGWIWMDIGYNGVESRQ